MQPPISADLQFQVYLHGGLIETNNSHLPLREETVELFTGTISPLMLILSMDLHLKKKHVMLGNAIYPKYNYVSNSSFKTLYYRSTDPTHTLSKPQQLTLIEQNIKPPWHQKNKIIKQASHS
jgi:hypothetical protein